MVDIPLIKTTRHCPHCGSEKLKVWNRKIKTVVGYCRECKKYCADVFGTYFC